MGVGACIGVSLKRLHSNNTQNAKYGYLSKQ